ncbi:hypothetical protein GOODEAATRI_020054, partial [Goodea atripinnis]
AEAVTLNDCLQLSYLPSKRNHMLLLYPREILILDLELSQTVGVVAIERSGVPFTQSVQELVYDLRSQCDAIRVTKTVRPYRMVICPVNENKAALMVSDGRVMLWELKAHTGRSVANPSSGLSPLFSPVSFCGAPLGPNQKRIQDLSLNSMISTSNGSVLVYNLTSGLLHKELSVHSCEVRGLEWVSLTSFLSFATSSPNNMGLVRNELQHVDLPTGKQHTMYASVAAKPFILPMNFRF